MIDWTKSAELNNTTVEELKIWFDRYPNSGKRIIAICDNPECKKERKLDFRSYRSLCRVCANRDPDKCAAFTIMITEYWADPANCEMQSERTTEYFKDPDNREKTRLALKNSDAVKKNREDETIKEKQRVGIVKYWSKPESHERASEITKKRYEDPEEREKTGLSMKSSESYRLSREKLKNDPEQGKRISAGHQHIPYDEWENFVKDDPYCPLFNEECRESNREKYGRRCFLTGLPESENMTSTGRQWKLSVHHVDMDKGQGCDGKRWKLVPLCMKYHGLAHSEVWMARIIWLLDNIWNEED